MPVINPRTVLIESDRVVKCGDPDSLRVEAEKTRQAQQIGEKTGWFRAPRVLGYDDAMGRMELERIEGISPLVGRLRARQVSGPLLHRLGGCLAALHAEVALPESMVRSLPDEWLDRSDPNVVIHGDLSVQNVQLEADGESLVILDFSMSPRIGLSGTIGHRGIDLAWFGRNLFMRDHFWHAWSAHPGDETIAFLSGYIKSAGSAADLKCLVDRLAELNDQFTSLVRGRKRPRRQPRWWYEYRTALFSRFLRSAAFLDRLARAVERQ